MNDARRLAAAVIDTARQRDVTIATAESCTGGLIAHLLTEVPGASAVYRGGWVTYANERKTDDLGVAESLIATNGAVSEAVAIALAEGGRARAASDYAVATTGIAGPEGGTPEKPAGTVWIGVAGPKDANALRFQATGDRSENKAHFAEAALRSLLAAIQRG